MDLDRTKVIVVNENTWENIKDQLTEEAVYSSNPMGVLGKLTGIDIIIDNELPDNVAEVYERYMYEAVKKFGRANDEKSERSIQSKEDDVE